jgi:hypothetical protein
MHHIFYLFRFILIWRGSSTLPQPSADIFYSEMNDISYIKKSLWAQHNSPMTLFLSLEIIVVKSFIGHQL